VAEQQPIGMARFRWTPALPSAQANSGCAPIAYLTGRPFEPKCKNFAQRRKSLWRKGFIAFLGHADLSVSISEYRGFVDGRDTPDTGHDGSRFWATARRQECAKSSHGACFALETH